jgi:two-component sensor histidine kinase
VVGELVTNACKHAPGPAWVELRIHAGVVLVTVWDAKPGAAGGPGG